MTRISRRYAVMPCLALLFLVLAGCQNPVQSERHRNAAGVVITDLQDQEIARLQGGQWQGTPGSPLPLQVGQALAVRVYFLDAAGDRFQLPHTGAAHTLRVNVADEGVATYQAQADHGVFHGVAEGTTTANVMVWHGSHSDFESQPHLGIVVTP